MKLLSVSVVAGIKPHLHLNISNNCLDLSLSQESKSEVMYLLRGNAQWDTLRHISLFLSIIVSWKYVCLCRECLRRFRNWIPSFSLTISRYKLISIITDTSIILNLSLIPSDLVNKN